MSVYESLGIRTVINAAGTVTTLGGSLMPPEVFYSMEEAGKAFVEDSKKVLTYWPEPVGYERAETIIGDASKIPSNIIDLIKADIAKYSK